MRLRNNPKAYEIMEENADLVILKPEEHKGHYHDIFEINQPLYIEIGMGKGDFIYQNALKHPENNYIGIEKFPSVLAAAINKINKNQSLPNLKLMHFDAIELENVFENGEIDHLFLNFSDPWPKKRHAKRRLTSSAFLNVYRRLLKKDGVIEFKTDNRGLFEYSLQSVTENNYHLDYVSLDLHNSPEADDNIMTEYERKFSVNGPIYKRSISDWSNKMDQLSDIISLEEYEKAIQTKSIILFTASWCPDCMFIKPFIGNVVKKYPNFTFYSINRDHFIDLCQDLDILGIPSFVSYENGQETGRFVSKLRKTQEEIETFIQSIK